MDVREKLADLLEEAPYNIYGDRIGNWCFKSGLEIAAEYLIARGVTVQTQNNKGGKTMTNADKIRGMSDEELAMCLYEIGYDEGWDKPEYALKWLQMPAEADNG